MGHSTDLQVDISGPIPLLEGDIILLCSDGLSGFVNAEDIDRTVAQNTDPTKCANRLVQLALASGSNDNITVQVLRIGNAAQTRRRARKTEPGSAVIASTPFWRNPWLLIAVAVVLLAAGGAYYWFRLRPIPTPTPKPKVIENRKNTTEQPEGKEHSKSTSGENEKPPQSPSKPAESKPEGKKGTDQEPPPDSQKPKPGNNGKTVPKPPVKPPSKPAAGTSTDDSGDAPQ
jgi:hypothetical protein